MDDSKVRKALPYVSHPVDGMFRFGVGGSQWSGKETCQRFYLLSTDVRSDEKVDNV